MSNALAVKPKDRDTILRALRAGVVPRLGLQHIQVGRRNELAEMVTDIDRISQGGGSIRLVIGEYGAGKTFFLFLVRQIALQRKLVVAQADLGPDRRIHATGGQARGLFAELTKNLSTRWSSASTSAMWKPWPRSVPARPSRRCASGWDDRDGARASRRFCAFMSSKRGFAAVIRSIGCASGSCNRSR
jgi:hypothetical protein